MTISSRILHPLFSDGSLIIPNDLKARDLLFEECPRDFAVQLNSEWHSRLPIIKMWKLRVSHAFHAYYANVTYAVALWSNPISATLPQHWIELRRMACAPDAPKFTASRFLGWMVRWFKQNEPEHERCISYQDTSIHKGIIYKASGWTIGRIGKLNDSNFGLRGKSRERALYNGAESEAAAKIRWEKLLTNKGE